MKLFAKYNQITVAATAIVFLLAGVAFYFALHFVLIEQVDESLQADQNELETYVVKYGKLPDIIPVKDKQLRYMPVVEKPRPTHYESVLQLDAVDKEEDLFRQLYFSVMVQGQAYQVVIGKSLEGTDQIIKSVVTITVITILLVLLVTIIINRIILRKLWHPFYTTITTVRNFKIAGKNSIQFPATDIDEFSLLNTTLQQALNKAEQDYGVLKEFTENASHELQTPLAIIRSKLDLLIQDENLSLQQSEAMQAANEALQKLSKLNQSLLLLAKIENRQFSETSPVHLKEKIEAKCLQFRELWQHLTLSVTLEDITVNMNNELAEIMLNNLFSNATRHNKSGGKINIMLTEKQLIVSNSATGKALDNTRLFTRFYKAEPSAGYHGLGLSMVKQICDVAGYSLSYLFIDNQHFFIIVF